MHTPGIVFSCEDIQQVRANSNTLVSLACWVHVTHCGGGVQRPGTPPLSFSPVSFYSSSEAWSVFTLRILIYSLSAIRAFRVSLTLKFRIQGVPFFVSFKICQAPFYYYYYYYFLATQHVGC